MKIYPYIFAPIISLISTAESESVGLKKCCPKGQYLDTDFQCKGSREKEEKLVVHQFSPIFNDFGFPNCTTDLVHVCEKNLKISSQNGRIDLFLPNVTQLTDSFHCHDNKSDAKGQQIPVENTCIDHSQVGPIVLYCPCLTKTCLRKCCPEKEVYHESKGCSPYNGSSETLSFSKILEGSESVHLLTDAFPSSCQEFQLLKYPFDDHYTSCSEDAVWRNSFVLLPGGKVQIRKYEEPFENTFYCIEDTLHDNGILLTDNLLICPLKRPRPIKFDVNGALLLLGAIILLLTVFLSSYVPELRDTLYLRVTLCHNVALMLASFIWGITNFLPSLIYPGCLILSLIIYYTFIASFFWMNVMCIDIAIAFRHLRSVYRKEGGSRKSFFWYSLYAWGTPAMLTVITATMELTKFDTGIVPRPGFGCQNCGFNPETYAILLYFYGPMIFILSFNLMLFLMIIFKIFKIQRQTSVLKTNDQEKSTLKYRSNIERSILFGKMFILMGLTWITEILSWAIGGPSIYWYLPDTINFLRAVFIFIIFICKKSVWSALKTKRMRRQRRPTLEKSRSSKSSSCEIQETRFFTKQRH